MCRSTRPWSSGINAYANRRGENRSLARAAIKILVITVLPELPFLLALQPADEVRATVGQRVAIKFCPYNYGKR
jgi:hypothetical protein